MSDSSSVTLTTDTTRGQVSYRLKGRIFHAGYGCPTWELEGPGLGCSATAWLIDVGLVGGLNISNLVVITVVTRGEEPSAEPRLVALIDQRATPDQVRALVDVFQGRLGGPLSCFALLAGTWTGAYQVPIEHTSAGGMWTFSVPDRLSMAIALPGSDLAPGCDRNGDTAMPIDWALGWAGKGVAFSMTLPEESLRFEAQNCEGFFAFFAAAPPQSNLH